MKVYIVVLKDIADEWVDSVWVSYKRYDQVR